MQGIVATFILKTFYPSTLCVLLETCVNKTNSTQSYNTTRKENTFDVQFHTKINRYNKIIYAVPKLNTKNYTRMTMSDTLWFYLTQRI